jgi:thiol-disulfide isomerase/thioredoxin
MLWLQENGVRCLLWLMLMLPVGAEAFEDSLNARFRPINERPDALDFALEDRFGEVYRLSQHRGQVLVVNFWATWCGPCLAELPTMQVLWERLSGGPFELLAINVGEERSTIDRFLNNFHPTLGFRILIDPKMRAAREWQVRGIPTTYIVDRQGRLVEFAEGGINFTGESVVKRIRQLMDEGG